MPRSATVQVEGPSLPFWVALVAWRCRRCCVLGAVSSVPCARCRAGGAATPVLAVASRAVVAGHTGPMELRRAWEAEAGRWIAWARTSNHDSYGRHHRRQLLGLVPPPGRLTLDLGCGEGRVGRDLTTLGHRVVGIDVVSAMVRAAADDPAGAMVAQGDAARLPVRNGAADLVVAFMSPQDVDDLNGLTAEAARVLEPGGRCYLAMVHPLNSGGQFDRPERPASLVLRWPYNQERYDIDDIERDGMRMRFVSRHRPLERYARALESAGFVIETVREPTDPDPASRWFDVPLFLHVVAVKPPVAARADRRIFHIATAVDADRLAADGVLLPPSLETEGFVHCSTAAQVMATTERWFAPEAELVLLELDPERLESDVAWPEVYPGQRFPHLLGPLTAGSVVRRHAWGPTDRLRW